jgi:hypothetical protein
MSVPSRTPRLWRWAARASGVTLAAALTAGAVPAPFASASTEPVRAIVLAPSTDLSGWVAALDAATRLRGYVEPGGVTTPDPSKVTPDVKAIRSYLDSLAADRKQTLQVLLPSVVVGPAADRLAQWAAGTGSATAEQALADVNALETWIRQDVIGVENAAGNAADDAVATAIRTQQQAAEQLTAVTTAAAAQAGEVGNDVIATLPTADELLNRVRSAQVILTRGLPVVNPEPWTSGAEATVTATVANALVAGDRALVAVGKQVTGAADAGAALSSARDDIGAVYDALDALLNTEGAGSDDLAQTQVPEQEVTTDDVGGLGVVVPSGITNPARVPGPLDAQLDLVNATAAPVKGRCYMRNAEACMPPLTWRGGLVQHKPVVYLVFWGPKWSNLSSYRDDVTAMFGELNNNGFQDVLTQHYDKFGGVGGTVTVGGTWQDTKAPTAVTTVAELSAEAVRAANANHWRINNDAQVIIFMEPGAPTTRGGDDPYAHCGFHTYSRRGTAATGTPRFLAYSAVNYPGQTPVADYTHCGGSNRGAAAGLRMVASHEYAETVTDPMLDAWMDGTDEENADLCAGLNAGSNGVTALWSNDGGTGYCTWGGFTPRRTYALTQKVAPPAEPNGSGYTRGHRHDGGAVIATNTGNMPWFPGTSRPTRLGVINPNTGAPDDCSPSADPPRGASTDPSRNKNPWLSCRRIKMSYAGYRGVVEPNGFAPQTGRATFDLRFKPDGSVPGGSGGAEAFRVVTDGTAWLSGSAAKFTRNTGSFAATPLAADGAVLTTPIPMQAGTTQTVKIVYNVGGTSPWYGNEVVYLGTAKPDGHASRLYDPATWPRSSQCSKCRATRMKQTVQPGQQATFDVTVRAPSEQSAWGTSITEWFRPVVEIPRNEGGTFVAYFANPVSVTVTVLPNPGADHTVLGTAVTATSAQDGGLNTSDAANPASTGYRFACAAAAGADASTTQVTACSATVYDASGAVTGSYVAPATAVTTGPVAVTQLVPARFDPAAGDTISVCWAGTATFADGERRDSYGCSG